MPVSYACPRCGKAQLSLLHAGYNGVEPFLPTSLYKTGDRIGCEPCGWIGHREHLKKEIVSQGLRTEFEWNVQDNSYVRDENWTRMMEIAPDVVTPFYDFMTLVHPDDRPGIVEGMKCQFEKGGLHVSHFRLAKPPHKRIYFETTLKLDEQGRPFYMTGWLQEWMDG